MAGRKRLTGYTENTMQNRQTGAGVYLKNFDVETDTFTTAVAAGKLIGATQGGGSFSAVPTITTTEIDGVPSDAVGMEDIDGWTAEMTANIVEVTAETMAEALGASVVTAESLNGKNYRKVTGKMYLEESDYRDNITFLGSMSGFDEPLIIQIYNAIAMEGVNINPQDKKTTLNSTKWKAHSSFDNLDEAPFAIYVPFAEGSQEAEGTTDGITLLKATHDADTKETLGLINGVVNKLKGSEQ